MFVRFNKVSFCRWQSMGEKGTEIKWRKGALSPLLSYSKRAYTVWLIVFHCYWMLFVFYFSCTIGRFLYFDRLKLKKTFHFFSFGSAKFEMRGEKKNPSLFPISFSVLPPVDFHSFFVLVSVSSSSSSTPYLFQQTTIERNSMFCCSF